MITKINFPLIFLLCLSTLAFGCPTVPEQQGTRQDDGKKKRPQILQDKKDGALWQWRGPGRKFADVEKEADGTPVIKISMDKPGQGILVWQVETGLYAGHTITVTCQAKAEGVGADVSKTSGPAFALRYQSGGRNKVVRPDSRFTRTTDWQDLSIKADIPTDAKDLSVIIGLRDTTGTIRFKNFSFSGGLKGSAEADGTETVKTFKRVAELFPYPKEIVPKEGLFVLRDSIRVRTADKGPGRQPAEVLVDEIRRKAGLVLSIDENAGYPCISLDVDESLERPEEYTLDVSRDGIKICGKNQRGIFNGIYTLLQLMDGKYVRCCSIVDYPDFEMRSFHIVLSNFVRWPDMVPKVLAAVARLKFNQVTVMMRAEVDWTSHPEAVENPARAFSTSDLKRHFDAARRMGLIIIPEIQSLGHANWCEMEKNVFLTHGSKYKSMFEIPVNPDPRMGARHSTFCTKSPMVRRLLKDIYSEAIGFCGDAPFLHAGMDEGPAHASGKCCINDDGAVLLADYIKDLNTYIRSKGRSMIIFHDMFLKRDEWSSYRPANAARGSERAIDLIPKDVIIGVWCYRDYSDFPMIRYFREKGFQVIGYSWGTRMGTRDSVIGMVRTLKKYDCLGFCQTTWGALQESPWLLVFGAEAAWNSTDAKKKVGSIDLVAPANVLLK